MGEEKAKPKLPDFAMSEAIDKAHDIIKRRMEESLITGSKPCPECDVGTMHDHNCLSSACPWHGTQRCDYCGVVRKTGGHEEKE